jgi:hypothetical protein
VISVAASPGRDDVIMDLEPTDRPAARYGLAGIPVAGDPVLDARRQRQAAQTLSLRRRRHRAAAAALCVGVVALGLVLALTLPGEISDEPTIVQAAGLTVTPATSPAPERNVSHPSLLDSTISGPAHPYWQETLGWAATGARTDFLGDRQVITVFYEREGQRIGYAIVEGAQLPPPVATTDKLVEGRRLRTFVVGGRPVVTWLRGGRTCVLSGRDVDLKVLVELAAGPRRPTIDTNLE